MRSRIIIAVLAGVLSCSATLLRPSSARSAEPAAAINTAYFCDDINAAIVIHPRRILESPLLKEIKPEDRDDLFKDMKKDIHCDPADLDEVAVVIVGPAVPEEFDVPPEAARAARGLIGGVITRFHSPVDKDAFAKKDLPGAKAAEFHGKAYLRSDDPLHRYLWFPDDKTAIECSEVLLQKMMGAEKGAGVVADLLQKAGGDHDVVAVLAMKDRLHDQLKEQTMRKDMQVPPNFKGLLSLPDRLKTAVLVADSGGKSLLSLTLTATNEDDAGALYSYLIVLRDAMKIGYAEVRPKMEKELPPEAAAQFLKVADATVGGFKFKRNDAEVLVTLPTPAGWEDFPKTLVPLVAKAVNSAKQAKQLMQLHRVHTAWSLCKMRTEDAPITDITDKNGKPLLSWRVKLLPYLDGKLTLKDFHLDEPWDSEHNRKLVEQLPPEYGDSKEGLTSCFAFVSGGAILANRMAVGSGGGTIALVQAGPEKAVPWTKPSDIELDRVNPAAGIGKVAGGKANAVFNDGHVQKIDVAMDPARLLSLILPAQGADEKDAKPEEKATPADAPPK